MYLMQLHRGNWFAAKSWYSIVQVLTLVLLSFGMQSDLGFYKKDLKGIQKRMPLFVSEINCILCLRVDGVLY